MVKITIGSLNCRGLSSDKVKRQDIFQKCRQKYDIALLVDTHCKKELETYWRSEWGYDAKFCSHTTNSRGVAILFQNSFQYEILKELHDESGNFLIISIKVHDLKFTLAVVYGPNSDNPTFIDNLQQKIESFGNSSVIVGGDWNVPQNYAMDTINYVNKNNPKSQEKIHHMMEELDLVDTFRELHQDIKRFSWRGPNKKHARLDYFLSSSDFQAIITESEIGVAYRSDHSPIHITINFNDNPRGKGTWKFNNSLLYDRDYIDLIKKSINDLINQYKIDDNDDLYESAFSIDDQLLWETLKMSIRGKTISYSSFKKKERDKRETTLENELAKLNENFAQNEELIKQKDQELKAMREEKIKGIIMRTKAKWNVEGDRSTKYFCNLEKRHFTEKTIPKLIMEDESEITNQTEILKAQKSFYENLYSSRNTEISDRHSVFFDSNNPFISKLNPEDTESLEGNISSAEMLFALKNMKNGKSPGIDGYTAEFYKFFWSDLKFFIIRSFNQAYARGGLSVSQRQGVITCLPKEGKSKFYLKNWRPISLLNVDYKICASTIAFRIKKVLPKIISDTQMGFMKGRYIGECTRLICDIIEKCEENEIPGLLMLLDFEKAFDSVEWNFIEKSLEFQGFGPSIIHWFKTFYRNSESCILNNGHLSERFKIERGVRQGDPLSPYLFILSVELLSAAIKFDPQIKGISVNNSEFLISQYADDSSLILDDDLQSVNKALDLIELYSTCSGLRANFDKTQAVWIGARRGCGMELPTKTTVKWNHSGCFKLLGIQYSLSKQEKYIDNFTQNITKIKKLLKDWSLRNISLVGKITVIKSMALPILVQSFTVLPDPPGHIIKEIQDIFFNFLWNSQVDKVKRTTVVGVYDEGGLKMPHILSFMHALKVSWIKKILDPNNAAPWKVLLADILNNHGQEKFWFYTKSALNNFSNRLNPFWRDVVNIWASIKEDPSTAPEHIIFQPLWNNSNIKIGGRPIPFSRFAKPELFFVNDMIKEAGMFLTPQELQEKYDIALNFLEYHSLVHAIPQRWRNYLIDNRVERLENITNKYISLIRVNQKVVRPFYNILLERCFESPKKSQNKWIRDLGLVEDENFEIYYDIPFKTLLSTKLQSFQYKINLRILYTNSLLLKCKLSETELCSYCFETKESLIHLFFECNLVRTLWLQLRDELRSKCNITMDITPISCTLGYPPFYENCEILNTCLIIIRYYIYVCRIKKEILNWTKCLETLKYFRDIDLKSLYLCSNRQSLFTKLKWQSIDNLFQSDE